MKRHCIFKRLDRVLVNNAFMELFPTPKVHHLVRQGSDHAPLHLICNTDEPVNIKPFKFLNFWTKHMQFLEIVKDNGKVDFVGSPFLEFQVKMKMVQKALLRWSKEVYGTIFQ